VDLPALGAPKIFTKPDLNDSGIRTKIAGNVELCIYKNTYKAIPLF
jgi:hypothetical protein